MADLTREQLIELITKEVLKKMNQDKKVSPDPLRSSVLVIGSVQKVPADVSEKYNCRGIDDYDGDIRHFEKVLITGLTMVELADIALGRNTKSVQCAVINALLQGKEIVLYDFALEHRHFKTQSNQTFYLLMESYVNILKSFDIKFVSGHEDAFNQKEHISASSANPCSGVVTEAKAKELVQQNSGDILLKNGTVLTPSAKDVFYSKNRQVRFI